MWKMVLICKFERTKRMWLTKTGKLIIVLSEVIFSIYCCIFGEVWRGNINQKLLERNKIVTADIYCQQLRSLAEAKCSSIGLIGKFCYNRHVLLTWHRLVLLIGYSFSPPWNSETRWPLERSNQQRREIYNSLIAINSNNCVLRGYSEF